MLFLYPHTAYPLVPRVNGSLPRLCSDLLRRSTPLRTTSRKFPLAGPLPHLRRCPPSSSLSLHVYNASPHSARSIRSFARFFVRPFVRSFVRSCYSRREHPGVSETSMRATAPLFSSLSVSLFPFALPYPPPTHSPGHPRAPLFSAARVPSPSQSGRVSTVNRYFRSDAFRLSISRPLHRVNSTRGSACLVLHGGLSFHAVVISPCRVFFDCPRLKRVCFMFPRNSFLHHPPSLSLSRARVRLIIEGRTQAATVVKPRGFSVRNVIAKPSSRTCSSPKWIRPRGKISGLRDGDSNPTRNLSHNSHQVDSA